MERNEDFWLRYNDGSGWQTIATYVSGTDFTNNSCYSATVSLNSSQFNLINGGKFRFQCDASGNRDRIFIDAVVITGFNGSRGNSNPGVIAIENNQEVVETYPLSNKEDEFSIYPNPAQDILNIKSKNLCFEPAFRNIFYKICFW